MGYELVRIGKDGEPKRIHEIKDPNYFRLNTDMIGRARILALWGAGVLLNTDMLNYTNVYAGLMASNPSIEEVDAVHKLSEDVMTEWIKPFTTNNPKKVAYDDCRDFAGNLEIALTYIRDSPVKPEYDTELLWVFTDFLRSCKFGVWVE